MITCPKCRNEFIKELKIATGITSSSTGGFI